MRKQGLPEYGVWLGMRRRCYSRNSLDFPNYGGRGIAVCDRWRGLGGFDRFLEDMGYRPSAAYTIDRIDNDGNYDPANCRWATRKEQQANRRTSIMVVYQGQRLTLREAHRVSCSPIGYDAARKRIKDGWEHNAALDTPRQKQSGPRQPKHL